MDVISSVSESTQGKFKQADPTKIKEKAEEIASDLPVENEVKEKKNDLFPKNVEYSNKKANSNKGELNLPEDVVRLEKPSFSKAAVRRKIAQHKLGLGSATTLETDPVGKSDLLMQKEKLKSALKTDMVNFSGKERKVLEQIIGS